jgi:putative ATP-binding cassette transporter
LFLPQRPYLPLGTLRHVVCYPGKTEDYPEEAVLAALREAGLEALSERLDDEENWSQLLSGGEQQRLALARALLARPAWLFLDEATASLDPDAEAGLYATLKRCLPDTTIISIAHRPTVAALHERHLVFDRPGEAPGRLEEVAPSA